MIEIEIKEVIGNGTREAQMFLLSIIAALRNKLIPALRDMGIAGQHRARLNAPELKGIRGGIVAHIAFEVKGSSVRVFVPRNSPAGIYAPIMHAHKGNWGPITRAKGPDAGANYIKRAVKDPFMQKKYLGILKRAALGAIRK